jgi:hypothetical protein
MVVLVPAILALAVPAAGVGAAGASAPASAGASASASAKTYVGTVSGVGSLGLVVDDDGAFGYLCDSDEVTSWFTGSNDGGSISLQAADGSVIAAGVTGKKVDGVYVSGDGTATDFVLRPATGEAGLFRQEQVIDGTGYAAGWVVLKDGTTDGQVSTANLPGAAVLPTPVVVEVAGATAPEAEILGTVAPPAIAAAFPADPPPDDEVTVVPFTTGNQQTDQTPGGDGTGATEPGATPTTTPVPVSCVDPGKIRDEIKALQASLDEVGLLKRRAIKNEIKRLQAIVATAEANPGLNCLLPLK